MARNTLFIMVKYPEMGRVKTRLGRGLGPGRSVQIYRSLMSRVFKELCQDRRWQSVLAISPDNRIDAVCWPLSPWRIAQGDGHLGERMGRIMSLAPSGPVVIIGADCPYIGKSDIDHAFASLKKNDVVFGPSEDGGYWLVGQKGLKRPDIFRQVRWSTRHTLKDTLKNCQGLKVGYGRTLQDIDEREDYLAWARSGAV